jgi:transposase-like protein
MMKERKQYTKEFKEGAARLVTEQGRTIADSRQESGCLAVDNVALGQNGED